MGYRKEKEKADRKWRKFKFVVAGISVLIIACMAVFSAFYPPSTWKYYVKNPKISKRKSGELRIHFLDVGQGDCTLIELPDGKTMLIDAGDGREGTAKTILRYLNALKIDVIDYLVITHPDGDHCGGGDIIVRNKRIRSAYLPPSLPTVNTEYAQLYDALLDENCKMTVSSMKEVLSVKDSSTPYTLAFLYPYSKDVSENSFSSTESNEQSCVLWLDYLGASALFMGDAPVSTEEALMRREELDVFSALNVDLTSTEILKVAHHGSEESTSLQFLQLLNVQLGVISCGANNLYNHPHEKVLNNLEAVNADMLRTDKNGNIVVSISSATGYKVLSDR